MSGERGIYKMRTISERTGLSPSLLRAWERRHGLLKPERTEGGHRLYTELDLQVLQRVCRLLEEGRSIGELASLGRGALLASQPKPAPAPAPEPSSELGDTLDQLKGTVVRAATALDEPTLQSALDEAFSRVAPGVALAGVVFPALHEIGERWARGECSIAGEHLVSAKVIGRLCRLLEHANPQPNALTPRAVCASLPEEQHVIGALTAAYEIARHGYHVHYLGACMPFDDLSRSCATIQPRLVALSVVRPELMKAHEPALIAFAKQAIQDGAKVVLGGPGIAEATPAVAEAGVILQREATLDQSLALR